MEMYLSAPYLRIDCIHHRHSSGEGGLVAWKRYGKYMQYGADSEEHPAKGLNQYQDFEFFMALKR